MTRATTTSTRVLEPFTPRLTRADLGELWAARDLVLLLGLRDLRSRYRQTALGVVWVVLQPLLAATAFSFVFSRVARLQAPHGSYFVFAMVGMLGWTYFSSHLVRVSASLVSNTELVSKIYFPRLALPASVAVSTAVDLAVGITVMALVFLVTGTGVGLPVLLLPAWVLLMLAFATGVGLVVGAVQVYFRDVGQVVGIGMQFLLYMSPVAYSAEQVPESYRTAYLLNPVAPLLEGFRWSLGQGDLPDAAFLVYGGVVAVLALLVGPALFKRFEGGFADVI